MKKTIAFLSIALLAMIIASCTPDVQQPDLSKRVTHEPPAGYEALALSDNVATYVKKDASDNITHEFMILVQESTEDERTAIASKKMNQIYEKMNLEFEDNVKVSFVTINDFPAIQMDFFEEGNPSEYLYILSVGAWKVTVLSGQCNDLEEVHTDMLATMNSMQLEEFTFTNEAA